MKIIVPDEEEEDKDEMREAGFESIENHQAPIRNKWLSQFDE